MNGESEELGVVDNVETVNIIQVQTDTEACNVEVIEVENNDVLEYKGGVLALIDDSRWIPIEVSVSNEQDGSERILVNSEDIECVNVSNEEENVAIDGTTQVVILEDGNLAYIQPAKGEENIVIEEHELPFNEEETELSTTEDIGEYDISLSEVVEDDGLSRIEMVQTTVPEEKPEEKKKGKSYPCILPGCNRSYSTLHHLKVHWRNHTGDRPFKCTAEGCTKAFSTDYSRKAHLRTHTGEKPYSCPSQSCSKKFKTSGDLQKHIRIHTGEKPFICPFKGCNRSFTTSNIRKVHIRTHTGEKPYACTHEGCDKSFASSTNFKNHMRIHSGVKPFCCKVPNCLKRFTEYSSLYKHQLVHSQQKKHECNFCHKTYRQPSTLTTHKRTAHGVISADDGTEIVIQEVIGLGGSKSKNFKDITSQLLKLKRDCSTIVTIEEEGDPLYLVSTDEIDDVNGLEDSDILL